MAERETPGQRIRNLREAAFITQKDFAERIGVAPSQLSRIESGETKTISSDILIAIATEFDVSTDYLLGLSENRFPQNIGIGKILGLSDEAIEIIQNINEPEFSDNLISISESCVSKTKLLNETIEHPLFSTILHYLQTAHFCYNSKNESINITIGPEKSSIESGRGLSLKAGQVAEFYQRIAIDLFSRLTEYLVFDLEEGEE